MTAIRRIGGSDSILRRLPRNHGLRCRDGLPSPHLACDLWPSNDPNLFPEALRLPQVCSRGPRTKASMYRYNAPRVLENSCHCSSVTCLSVTLESCVTTAEGSLENSSFPPHS